MFLKLIGGILIILACGFSGIIFSNRSNNRPRDLKRFRSLMQMLETEIIYSVTPLPEALYSLSNKSEARFSSFFAYISDCLRRRQFFSFRDAWVSGVNTVLLKETSLSNTDAEIISNFGNVLGCSDRNDQKKHFELLYIQLKHNEAVAEEERKKNTKMYRSLGFLLGIAIFIILA